MTTTLPLRFGLPLLLLCGTGCHHHYDRPPGGNVVVYDAHGYRHEGFRDDRGDWHGGYYDEHNAYHGDAHDFR